MRYYGNTLGDLLNRCTSKFINSSQIYPQLHHSIYDSMCNKERSELMRNLRELPSGSYMKCSTCLSLFICTPWLLVMSGLNLRGASPVHFISKYICQAASCPGLLALFLLFSSDDGMILIYYRVKIIMTFYF